MGDAEAIVIGAGAAGLATAACLKRARKSVLILEKADAVGEAWRQRYDRLHLHTDRAHSGLPGMPMPAAYPRYPGRADVADYLERYREEFDLRPCFGVDVTHAHRDGDQWSVQTSAGAYAAPNLIVATGFADRPQRPTWPGEEHFGCDILHSSAYRNPAPYIGRKVLVVGLGNSGAEIALDLAEHGAKVAIAVRGPANIVPRDLFGIPILSVAILLQPLPPALADALSAPIVRLAIGRLTQLGLARPRSGPFVSIAEHRRIPVLDVGTVAKIRDGTIAIRPDIRALSQRIVEFTDGRREAYDAIIAATGFRPGPRKLLPHADDAFREDGVPLVSGRPTPEPGLYFCGFHISPTGQLREIGLEARRIANHIAMPAARMNRR
jgi:cation diffusion facilitator CzcD-associated flavoprotein CzcO